MTTPPPSAIASRLSTPPDYLTRAFKPHAPLAISELRFRFGDGPWLEQLCCRLAVRLGYAVHYFGRNGQAQFGIDLVGTRDGRLAYWQCKNFEDKPVPGDLKAWVSKILDEAVSQQGLPMPYELILCCPHELEDTELDSEFLELQAALAREDCGLHWWGREHLSNALRTAPDVVAELFGDTLVKLHCHIDYWHADMWLPLDGREEYSLLARYLNARNAHMLWRDDEGPERPFGQIAQALEQNPVTVVRGPSGAGKTFAVLDLCERQLGWRTYFLNLRHALDSYAPAEIANAMAARLSRPTIFIIDDIHDQLEKLADVVDRFRRLAGFVEADWRIVCIARSAGASGDGDDEEITTSEWLEALKAEGALVNYVADTIGLRAFVRYRRPDWSTHRIDVLDRLVRLCANNLYLLEEACVHLESPLVEDREGLRRVLREARLRLRVSTASTPCLIKAATLAQFELNVPTAYFDKDTLLELETFAHHTDWVEIAGQPPRIRFTHAAAAEVTLHTYFDPIQGMPLVRLVADELQTFLQWYAKRDATWLSLLRRVLRLRPAWLSPEEDGAVKCALLSSLPFADQWVVCAEREDPPLLALALWIATMAKHPLATRLANAYVEVVFQRLQSLSSGDANLHWLGQVNMGLRSLRLYDETVWRSLLAKVPAQVWLRAIIQTSLPDFLGLVEYSTPEFAAELIDALDGAAVDALVNATLAKQRSIGTVGIRLRELQAHDRVLGRTGENRLLGRLLRKIGVQRWLRLLFGASLPDFLRLVQNSTPEFAAELIDSLDEVAVDALIDATLAKRRSIGAITFPLRELQAHDKVLGHTGENRLLVRLERKIGVQRWLRLLSNASLNDLLSLLQGSTAEFATELTGAMDEPTFDELVDRTNKDRLRSVVSVGIPLAQKKVAAMLGMPRVAKALLRICPLGSVFHVVRAMQGASREDLVRELVHAPLGSWMQMASRAETTELFYETCELLGTWDKFGFTLHGKAEAIRSALQDLAVKTARAANWYPLRSGLERLRTQERFPAWAESLLELPRQRAGDLDPAALAVLAPSDLHAVREIIWTERPDLTEAWLDQARIVLLSESREPKNFVRWAPALLFWLHDSRCSGKLALECVDRLVCERLGEFAHVGDSVQTFLLLWNALLVVFQHDSDGSNDLKGVALAFGKNIPDARRELVLDMISGFTKEPVAAKRFVQLLPLVGMVGFLDWPLPRTPGLNFQLPSGKIYPLGTAMGPLGFVAATFMQIGAALALHDTKAWSADRIDMLRTKCSELKNKSSETIPRAVLALMTWVESQSTTLSIRP